MVLVTAILTVLTTIVAAPKPSIVPPVATRARPNAALAMLPALWTQSGGYLSY